MKVRGWGGEVGVWEYVGYKLEGMGGRVGVE